jgi:hypothetical protein
LVGLFCQQNKSAFEVGRFVLSTEGNSLLNWADAFAFHQPYHKLVMKSFARLMLNDFLSDPNPDYEGQYSGLEAFRSVK